MEEEKKKSQKKIIFLVGIIFLVVFILSVVIFLLLKANYYNNYVLKSIYVDKYNISDVKFNDLNDKIDQISAEILKKNISFNVSSNTFSASYEELGIALDRDSLIKEIKDYQKGLGINNMPKKIAKKKQIHTQQGQDIRNIKQDLLLTYIMEKKFIQISKIPKNLTGCKKMPISMDLS